MIVTIHLLVAGLAYEILFTKVLDFFNMWVFVRTSMSFAHLASFQAIEYMDQPIPKAVDNLLCQTSEVKAIFRKGSFLYAKNENTN